jgi:MFS family permease
MFSGIGYAWVRLVVSMILLTTGGSGMYAAIVSLQPIAAEFGLSRSAASMPYLATMIGFGLGGVMMGRLSDRIGVMKPALFGGLCLGLGYIGAAYATSLWTFTLVHGVLIGFLGMSPFMAPLVADISHWFKRRRGLAVGIVISGSYVAGTIWPPVIQHYVDTIGWRAAYSGMAVVCFAMVVVCAPLLYRRHAGAANGGATDDPMAGARPLGMSRGRLQNLLCCAGVGCCVAMAMPQVHLIAYATDLGFTAARGAEMLSLMLACGVVSRLVSGLLSDRIGGLLTLLIGSSLQGLALIAFTFADTLTGLYVVAACFGLSQGGIVPAYAIIVRTYFPAGDAGGRTGMVLMFTLVGMAVGGWMAGKIFDLTGSYDAAFINAIGFNILNMIIAGGLLQRARRAQPAPA